MLKNGVTFLLKTIQLMTHLEAFQHQACWKQDGCMDPNFLRLSPKRWPTAPTLRPISKDDPEVKEAVTFTAQTTTTQSPVDKLIDRISNWTQLVRSVACFTLIPEVHRRKTRFTGPLGPEHLQQAENLLIRHVQSQCYSEEIKAIAQGCFSLELKPFNMIETRASRWNISSARTTYSC